MTTEQMERAAVEGKLIDVTSDTYKARSGGKVFITQALYEKVLRPSELEIERGHTYAQRVNHLVFNYTVSRTGEPVFNFAATFTMEQDGVLKIDRIRARAIESGEDLTLALECEW